MTGGIAARIANAYRVCVCSRELIILGKNEKAFLGISDRSKVVA